MRSTSCEVAAMSLKHGEQDGDERDDLAGDPRVGGSDTAVEATKGVVTANGSAGELQRRPLAQAWRVPGIGEELRVQRGRTRLENDLLLAHAAESALRRNRAVGHERIHVLVENGFVWLDGAVDWWHQRQAAEDTVTQLDGLAGIVNRIQLAPRRRAW
jgi:osmotically-inducible protein OsmY